MENKYFDGSIECLKYWLLRSYISGYREGWEEGPSVAETMEALHCVLCNIGLDPSKGLAKRVIDSGIENLKKNKECDECSGWGVDPYVEEDITCSVCNGSGFIKTTS